MVQLGVTTALAPAAFWFKFYEETLAGDAMNLDGKSVPRPHPEWGVCADELLFYTSRYAGYTARRLAELGADPNFDMAGFHASSMSPTQRACMAQLLAFAPEPSVARAVATLTSKVASGEPPVPKQVRKIARKRRSRQRPQKEITPARPSCSTGLMATHLTDVLRHLGRRYGFSVVIAGRHIWVNDNRLTRLLERRGTREAANLQEILDALERRAYRLHLPKVPGCAIGCRKKVH